MESRFNSALIIAGAIIMDHEYDMFVYIGGFLIIVGIILQAMPFIKKIFK